MNLNEHFSTFYYTFCSQFSLYTSHCKASKNKHARAWKQLCLEISSTKLISPLLSQSDKSLCSSPIPTTALPASISSRHSDLLSPASNCSLSCFQRLLQNNFRGCRPTWSEFSDTTFLCWLLFMKLWLKHPRELKWGRSLFTPGFAGCLPLCDWAEPPGSRRWAFQGRMRKAKKKKPKARQFPMISPSDHLS